MTHQEQGITKVLISVVLVIISALVLVGGFVLLRQWTGDKVLLTITAVVWGLASTVLLYTTLNQLAEILPKKIRGIAVAFVFVAPALVLLSWFLLLPVLRTLWLSFFDSTGKNFVGLSNYAFAFTDKTMLESFGNNLLWMIVGTAGSVGLGLLIAVLADKSKGEKVFKALIFMPMAISFVGAGVIWKFMYAYKGEGINIQEIGLLNALVESLGGARQAWLQVPFLNNLLLIVIMIWLQTGYAMVILSSAIKSIPDEIVEAAQVDGASAFTIFWKVTVPYIMGTIITVSTTIVIFSLKLFDIVRVMTGGNFGTNVIANEFYQRQFSYNQTGQASAIAIVLLVAIIPVLIYNLKQFGEQKVLK